MLVALVGTLGSLTLSFFLWKCIDEIASDDISTFTIIPCYLGALISISPIIILPFDVAGSLLGYKNNDYFTIVKIFWKLAYFVLFILCWVIFPILLEYELSGDFDHNKKLKTSLERNKNHWITQIVLIAISSILYLTVFNLHNSKFSISSMCIAVAHFWGMAQITFLWGFGLVAIPTKIKNSRKLVNKNDIIRNLNRYYTILHNLEDWKAINHHEIKKLNDKLNYLYSISSDEYTKITIGKMIKVINESKAALIDNNNYLKEIYPSNKIELMNLPEKNILTIENLITINRELKLLIAEQKRIYYLWESTLSNSWKLENLMVSVETDLCDKSENSPLIFSSRKTLPMHISNDNLGNDSIVSAVSNNLITNDKAMDGALLPTNNLRIKKKEMIISIGYYLFEKMLTVKNKHLSQFLYTFSLVTSIGIIVAEATMYFPNLNISLYSHIIRICSQIKYMNKYIKFILVYFICQFLLIYVYVCTYWGLFYFKIPKKYGIYFNKHTDGPCIVFFSQFLCKLSTALCFHYLSILKIEETEFGKFYGKQIQHLLDIFGKDFNIFFFPIIVVLVYAINIFDLQGRLIRNSGVYYIFFEYYIFDDDVIGSNIEAESSENEKISSGRKISEVQKIKKTLELNCWAGKYG
ncbi:eukaryote specific membrane s signal peptide plus 8 transmembrane domain [Cryptosporidium sp. chipmunk genotype I]|uniref:eukaryote specific membrane s signal peptide plus 8 transmembrane domain n=1 Tax=Cryptosporidium sp. chipmunk genotype I TaxID=1280935 RepID=UPI00351A3461|nr:eukaryote specific membrane s signal peptide plus 8 transmembrane domain [Cryptosporidium sp. chipmunk genotype I]